MAGGQRFPRSWEGRILIDHAACPHTSSRRSDWSGWWCRPPWSPALPRSLGQSQTGPYRTAVLRLNDRKRRKRGGERGGKRGERVERVYIPGRPVPCPLSVPPSLLPSAGWQSWNSVRQIVVLGLHGTLFVSLWFTLQFEYLCVWLGWDIITLQAVQAVLVRDTTLSDGEMTWSPPYCPVLFLAGACKGWGLQWLGLEGYRKSVYDT